MPLGDFDAFGDFQDFGPRLPRNPFRRKNPDLELTEPQREGIIRRAGNEALSWVGTVGNLLGLPGSMAVDAIGGALTGDWTKYNPVDQLLTPTQSVNRVSGQKMLADVGAISNDDTWTNFGAGLGFEVLTDLLTWVGVGPLTKAGQIARKAGYLDEVGKLAGAGKRINQMNTPLRSVMHNIQDPLEAGLFKDAMAKSGANLGDVLDQPLRTGWQVGPWQFEAGPVARGIARTKDAIGQAVAKSMPGRAIAMLFDYGAQGMFSRLGQSVARKATRSFEKSQALFRAQISGLRNTVGELYDSFSQAFGKPADESMRNQVDELMRMTAELATDTKPWKDAAEQAMDEIFGTRVPGQVDKVVEVAQKAREMNSELFQRILDLGGNSEWFDSDLISHMPRAGLGADTASPFWQARRLATSADYMKQRRAELRDIPTEILNRMGLDDSTRVAKGETLADAAGRIASKYGAYLNPNDPLKHAEQVAGYFNETLAQGKYAPKTIGKVYGNALNDMIGYHDKMQRVYTNLRAVHELVAENVNYDGVGISLADAFKAIGLGKDDGNRALIEFMMKHGIEPGNMARAAVPDEAVSAAKSFVEKTTKPEWEKAFIKAAEKITGIFTRHLTAPFPAFAFRNRIGGLTNNLLSGEVSFKSLPKYIQAEAWAFNLMHKGPKTAADQKWLEELFTHDVAQWGYSHDMATSAAKHETIPPGVLFGHSAKEAHGRAMAKVDDLFADPTATATRLAEHGLGLPEDVAAVVGKAAGATAKPFKVGAKGLETWVAAGERLNQQVEFLNRVSMYKFLRDEGWSPLAAKARMEELQVAYHKLAPFEKQYLRRKLIPFYTYTRKYGETVVRQLLERPGGPLAQTIRASNRMRQGDLAMTPDYVANTLSIPWAGQTEDGSQRYTVGFGLGHEDPLQFAGILGGDVRGTGLELLSRTNPILKGLIEHATGASVFQRGAQGGRRLEDVDPLVGRILQNVSDMGTGERTYKAKPFISDEVDMLLANTPISRYLTTARQLTDPRKWENPAGLAMNLLSGARVTDVSPAAQDAMLSERLNEMQRKMGARSFTKSFFPEEVQATMTPEERTSMLLLKAMEEELRVRKQERKKALSFAK